MGLRNSNVVTVPFWQKPDASELNADRIVEFMGGSVSFVKLDEHKVSAGPGCAGGIIPGGYVIIHATVLAHVLKQRESGLAWMRGLTSEATKCLVYGFDESPEHCQILRELTGGGLVGTQKLPGGQSEFVVDAGARQICRQFSGLSIGGADSSFDGVFAEGESAESYSPLIRIGGSPFFVLTRKENCELYLLACRQVANLDELIPRGTSCASFFSRLVPFLMFIFQVSPDRFWHNDEPRGCFIIDDPLLRRHYGFLDYQKLLELMEQKRFSTCIAFIPWNYRRSDQEVVQLFKAKSHRYSLCVHGCDHTSGEFGATDSQYLFEQAQNGLHRMRQHGELTGLGFDEVMVFPQGKFSGVAINALKLSGYLAAVNSTPYPVDVASGTLQLRELLDVAVTRYSGFPLFVRRYPTHVFDLSLDLFLGKPALLVEHHGFFREGYAAMAQIIERLNSMEDRMAWSNLSTICSHACLRKQAENGDVHIKFYTDQFSVQNKTNATRTYTLFRRQLGATELASVRVNGVSAAFDLEGESLKISVSLSAGESAEIRIVRCGQESRANCSWKERKWQTGVFIRRVLSEFRDNHVDRNPLLSRMALAVRNRLVRKK